LNLLSVIVDWLGLIAASVEVGGVLSAVVVSYLGGRRHIPSWIGFGAIVMSVGTLLFTVPHMMAPAYTVTGLFICGCFGIFVFD